jgi:hypothetical protein
LIKIFAGIKTAEILLSLSLSLSFSSFFSSLVSPALQALLISSSLFCLIRFLGVNGTIGMPLDTIYK